MPRTIRFMSQVRKKFSFEKLTTDYFNFADLHKAMDKACNDKKNVIKVMIIFDK